jgi:hypothetical protein
MDRIQSTISDLYASAPEQLMAAGFGIGALLLFIAVATMLRDRNPAAVRIARGPGNRGQKREDRGLLLGGDVDPKGIMKGFLPDRPRRTHGLAAQAVAGGLSGP